MQHPSYFLILGNGRTGSTWLLTSLDRIPGVRARREIKWKAGYGANPTHIYHVYIDSFTTSLKNSIDEATGLDPGHIFRAIGSKLIFDPWYTSSKIFAFLHQIVENDIALVLLKRSYFSCWLSWKVRGVHHALDSSAVDTSDIDPAFVAALHNLSPPELCRFVLTVGGQEMPTSWWDDAVQYPLENAIDDLLVFFSNDLQLLNIVQERCGLVIDYSKIESQFQEITRHIGADATPEQVDDILRKPTLKRLPNLADRLCPNDVLDRVGNLLDDAFWTAVRGERPVADIWKWRDEATADVKVPGLSELLEKFGVRDGVRTHAPGNVNWALRRATYDL